MAAKMFVFLNLTVYHCVISFKSSCPCILMQCLFVSSKFRRFETVSFRKLSSNKSIHITWIDSIRNIRFGE